MRRRMETTHCPSPGEPAMLLCPHPSVPGRRAVLVLCTLGLVGALGCGAAPVPVSGKVMLDKKPLTTGIVSFRPDRGKGNTNAVEPRGKIAEDGSYTLATNGKPGAPP